METTYTYTLQQLLDFALEGEHWCSVNDAIRFVREFANSQDNPITEEEGENLLRQWFNNHGHDWPY